MDKKKITLVSLSFLLVAVIVIGATIAYFTDTAQVTNTFTVGDIQVDINEPHWREPDPDSNTPGDGDGLVPGDTKIKDPVITEFVGDSYMRLIMTIKDKDTGNVITDQTRINKILQTLYYDSTYSYTTGLGLNFLPNVGYSLAEIAATGCSHVNEADFTKDTVRSQASAAQYVYNYNGIFTKDTKVIFMSHVIIPTDWDQDDIDALGKYTITFRVEAIQASNFDNAADAFNALDTEILAQR